MSRARRSPCIALKPANFTASIRSAFTCAHVRACVCACARTNGARVAFDEHRRGHGRTVPAFVRSSLLSKFAASDGRGESTGETVERACANRVYVDAPPCASQRLPFDEDYRSAAPSAAVGRPPAGITWCALRRAVLRRSQPEAPVTPRRSRGGSRARLWRDSAPRPWKRPRHVRRGRASESAGNYITVIFLNGESARIDASDGPSPSGADAARASRDRQAASPRRSAAVGLSDGNRIDSDRGNCSINFNGGRMELERLRPRINWPDRATKIAPR